MVSPTSDSLADRGRSHTRLRELLDARESLLHANERELLLDAADALLFDEPEGDEKLHGARELLTEMVESGRWLAGPADDVMEALEGCRPLAASG
jgi:hypothetical protein